MSVWVCRQPYQKMVNLSRPFISVKYQPLTQMVSLNVSATCIAQCFIWRFGGACRVGKHRKEEQCHGKEKGISHLLHVADVLRLSGDSRTNGSWSSDQLTHHKLPWEQSFTYPTAVKGGNLSPTPAEIILPANWAGCLLSFCLVPLFLLL